MIPILYEKDEKLFTSNGLCRLRDTISAVVTEERNGIYECDFEYPVTGANYDFIQCGRIVGVQHDDNGDVQPFDIVSYSKPIDGIVTFHATHISYRQSFITVKTSTCNSLADAYTMIRTGSPNNPFTYWTDKTSTGFLACADGAPRSVRQILGGVEGSILDTYGGEYKWDKWQTMLYDSRGVARDLTIRYGVNMLDYTDELDYSESFTSVMPYWTDGNEFVVGDRVDSGFPSYTGRDECVPLDVSDKFEGKPTKAQVESMASSMIGDAYLPQQTVTVEFARLQDLGYKDLENLYKCNLCDTVNVVFPRYVMRGKFKIVKTVWDVLQNRYESMELGTLSTTLSEALGLDNNVSNGNGTNTGDMEVENIEVFASSSISSGSHKYGTVGITKAGYYPVGIVGWNSPDTSAFVPTRLRLSAQSVGAGTISYDVRNVSSSSASGVFKADVFWVKGNLPGFGDLSVLGALAYKDTASGTVTVPKTYTTTVTPSTVTKYVAASSTAGGSASKETVTISKADSGAATYTPEGSNASSSVSGTCSVTPSGSISTGSGTANYTPAGTVGTPTITVTPSTTTKYVAGSATGGGSVTAGTAASCTLPAFTATVSDETLTLAWSAGSFSANTPTAVTLPSFSSQTIATGITSATSTQPTFSGTGAELKFTGSASSGTISGTAAAQTFTGTGVRLKTDKDVFTSVTMPSFSSQTIATGISSSTTTTATTESKTVTVS